VTPDLEVKQKKKLEVQRPRILSSALPADNVVLCTIALLLTDRLEATTFKRRLPTQSSFAASA
jgi:7-cyano-7-deazaguanine synthase in queuosine biosynthesis